MTPRQCSISACSVVLVAARHDDGVDDLAPTLVGDAEDGRLEHGGVGVEGVLDLGAVDVLAAGDDHVLGPVDEVQVAVGVEVADVAGAVPLAVEHGLGRLLGLVPVPGHHVRALDHDLADLAGRRPAARRRRRCAGRRRAPAGRSSWPAVRRATAPRGGRRWPAATARSPRRGGSARSRTPRRHGGAPRGRRATPRGTASAGWTRHVDRRPGARRAPPASSARRWRT